VDDVEAMFAESNKLLAKLLRMSVRNREKVRVLDLGCGRGHRALACKEAGIGHYVGVDFASADFPEIEGDYVFRRGDACDNELYLGAFDVVLGIDVAFHVVTPQRFQQFLETVQRHAKKWVFVTGIFEDMKLAPHVLHRDMTAFESLGTLRDVQAWQGRCKIARFRV